MRIESLTAALMLVATLGTAREPGESWADPPKPCASCEEWNAPEEPFQVFGNTWWVGPKGLGAVLITSAAGHVLLDGALPQSAPRIDASIRALGFRTEDVRLIVNSHAHFDHAGGIAALQRRSGARVAASLAGARALEAGGPTPDDPQYAFGPADNDFPPVPSVQVVQDGETLHVGDIALTAHYTRGHTPGSTSWTWRSCEGERCLDVVYADSLNAISAPGFRFTGDAAHPSSVAAFERSIDVVAGLPCDVMLAVHPGLSPMHERLRERSRAHGAEPVIDRDACRAYAARAREQLARRVEEEEKASPGAGRD